MMTFKNSDENGYALVEATLIFPIVILAISTMIIIFGFIYNKSATSARLNMDAHRLSGIKSDTVIVEDKMLENTVSTEKGHVAKKQLILKKELVRDKVFLLRKRRTASISSKAYIINEKNFIRNVDFIKIKN